MENNLFLSYEQIANDLLTCFRCHDRLTDPITLTCQHLVCRSCVPHMRESNDDDQIRVNCWKCGSIHLDKKLEDYETNLVVEKLLGYKPIRVARGADFEAKIEQTRKSAEDIMVDIKNADNLVNEAETKIADYFGKIKTQIDLSTEQKIEELQKARDEILKELNGYQEECKSHLNDLSRSIFTDFENFSKECQDMVETTNKPDCIEADVISSLKRIKDIEESVQEWKDKLGSNKLFCGKNIVFRENISAESVGCLVCSNLEFFSIAPSTSNITSLQEYPYWVQPKASSKKNTKKTKIVKVSKNLNYSRYNFY